VGSIVLKVRLIQPFEPASALLLTNRSRVDQVLFWFVGGKDVAANVILHAGLILFYLRGGPKLVSYCTRSGHE
jgi:hypothetical protein